MQAERIGFSDVASQCGELIRSRMGLVLATISLITVGFSAFDLFSSKAASLAPSLIVNTVVQYYFVESLLLGSAAASQRRKRRYASLFLAGLLASLGIIAGLVVLILPGIFLMARWSISTPFIVADGLSGSDALKASWAATSEARWVIFSIILLCVVALVPLFFGVGVLTVIFHVPSDNVVLSVLTNLISSLWLVGGWILGAGLYRVLKPSSNELAEVFA